MSIRARKPAKVEISKAAAYDTILRPIITEKATMANENGQVTFAVPLSATKPEIKAAVEMLFDVKVTAVNTILLKGKTAELKGKLAKLGAENALIIGGAEIDEGFVKAASNLPFVDVLPQQGINVYDILRRDVLVLSKDAAAHLEERLK